MSGILFNADPEPKAARLRIFPTNLLLIDNIGVNIKPLYEYILKDYHENETRIYQMRELYKHKIFDDLIMQIQMNSTNFCSMLKYKYENLKVTDVWANVLQPGEMHPPHTHSNNILSGVYCLKSGGGKVLLNDPRPQAWAIRPNVSEVSVFNTDIFVMELNQGKMIVLPSWVQRFSVFPQGETSENVYLTWTAMIQS